MAEILKSISRSFDTHVTIYVNTKIQSESVENM